MVSLAAVVVASGAVDARATPTALAALTPAPTSVGWTDLELRVSVATTLPAGAKDASCVVYVEPGAIRAGLRNLGASPWTARVVGLAPDRDYVYQVTCHTSIGPFEGRFRGAHTTSASGPLPVPPAVSIANVKPGGAQGAFVAPPSAPTACWYETSGDGKGGWARLGVEYECTNGPIPMVHLNGWVRFAARNAAGTRTSAPLRIHP